MKFNYLLSAVLISGLLFSSCNVDSDDDDNYMSVDYACSNLIIPNNGEAFATSAVYNLIYYYLSGNVVASTDNLNLGYGNQKFVTNAMPCETKLYTIDWSPNALDVTTFSGGSANSDGLSIRNLKGYASSVVNILSTNDPIIPAYPFTAQIPLVISYNVNNDYTVKTFMADAIYRGQTRVATVGSGEAPYTNDNIRYRVIFSKDYKKADFVIYNAKFADRMPVTINFVITDLDVAFTQNGYSITGSNLTPSTFEGGELTPAPTYMITSFEFINTSDDLSRGSAMYTVQMGPGVYNVDFSGYYVLSGQNN